MIKTTIQTTKKINELSQAELMEFIKCLNKNMQNYDDNIDRAIARSETAEWDAMKTTKHKGVNIRYAGTKR